MSVRDRAPASSPIFVPIVLHKKAVFVSVIKPGFHIFLWYCQCSVQINDTVKVLFSTLISSRLYGNSWYKQMNAQEHILDPETSKVYPDVPTLMVKADIAREPSTPMEHLQYQFHLWRARPHGRISYLLRDSLCFFYISLSTTSTNHRNKLLRFNVPQWKKKKNNHKTKQN